MFPGGWELLIILLIVLLIFGAKKLKNLGGDLGGAIKNFKKSMKSEDRADSQDKAEQVEQKQGRVIDGEVGSDTTTKEKDQA